MEDTSFAVELGLEGVVVVFSDERIDAAGFLPELVQSLCESVRVTLVDEGVSRATVDIFAADPADIAELNQKYMGHDGPTDVLSFPLDDASEGDSFGFRPHVGDIVICPLVACIEAPDHAGSVEAELHLLVIHGALHLLGHDHAEPAERIAMQERERQQMAKLGYGHPGDQQ